MASVPVCESSASSLSSSSSSHCIAWSSSEDVSDVDNVVEITPHRNLPTVSCCTWRKRRNITVDLNFDRCLLEDDLSSDDEDEEDAQSSKDGRYSVCVGGDSSLLFLFLA